MTLIKQPTPENILLAARNLKDGALIGLPTETVYGLAADAENENAVRRIYEVKGRPLDHPLIIHIESIEYLEKWAKDIPDYAKALAKKFWPGPITLILKRTKLAQNFITGGQETVAIRIPKHGDALFLLKEFHRKGGNGLAAPSANKYGKVSPTSAEAVSFDIGSEFREGDLIIDGGKCEIGIESTIISCLSAEPKILRPGMITEKSISKFLNIEISSSSHDQQLRFPGQSNLHYAPNVKIYLNHELKPGDGFLALKKYTSDETIIRLGQPDNHKEFAKILYSCFRQADKLNLERLVIWIEKSDGLSKAIIDRIQKASNT